ncbi:hypothetical protein LTR53_018560, partial [Teratosphaeriaceae sp. CCFEE 6253]
MIIHHLQVQRARRPEEIDQEGLAEMLVALPRDMQEEILRREAVEGKKKSRDKGAATVKSTEEPKRTLKVSSKRNTLGQDFFGQKSPDPSAIAANTLPQPKSVSNDIYPLLSWVRLEAEASISAGLSLATNAQPAHLFSTSRIDLSLVCPNLESTEHMDALVRDLARTSNADLIKLSANDFAELASEYVDGG